MRTRNLGRFLYLVGLLIVVGGLLMRSVEVLAFSTFMVGTGYVLEDYFAPGTTWLSPMTVYAAIMGSWWGVANIVGYRLRDTDYESIFLGYADQDYLYEAQILATLIGVVPLVVYRWFTAVADPRKRPPRLVPEVGFEVSDAFMLRFCLILLGADAGLKLVGAASTFLGTFSILAAAGSTIAIFLLSWHWYGPNPRFPRWTWLLLWGAILGNSVYALLFAYMRGQIVYPFMALMLGIATRKAITWRFVGFTLALLIPFSIVYKVLGEIRGSQITGTDRLAVIARQDNAGSVRPKAAIGEDGSEDWVTGPLTLLARGCNYDQLTNVVYVAETDGFYDGATIAYLTYAFIPRAIWPDKPLIAPGQWFAERIGHGMRIRDDKFSNSINMTLAGEFYLNFGWSGAVVGLILFAGVLFVCWNATAFHKYENNPVGGMLSVLLLTQCSAVSSAAALVQIVFYYIMTFALSRVIILLVRRQATRREGGAAPHHVVAPDRLLQGSEVGPRQVG